MHRTASLWIALASALVAGGAGCAKGTLNPGTSEAATSSTSGSAAGGGGAGTTTGEGGASNGTGGATTAGSGGSTVAGSGGSTTNGTGGGTTTGTGGGATTGAGGSGGGEPPHPCGDGMIGPGEECDGANLNGATCVTAGFAGGTITCNGQCKLDTSKCDPCHNGVIQPALGEDCDFDAMQKPLILATCQSLGFMSPNNPGCDPSCHYDTTPCLCGNGMIEGAEQCDGNDLGGKSCADEGFGGGVLKCTSTCQLDFSSCTTCGNGMIDAGEPCDGADLGGKTCLTQGFTAGQLACGAGCQLSTAGCTKCGNGVLEAGEACDDGNVASGDGCSAACTIEILACDPDGQYAIIMGGPISYSCCGGLVAVNISSFFLQNDGASILSSPSNPATMIGQATTCPSGSFNDTVSIPGGCTETYTLSGSFTGPNTFTGIYTLGFIGQQCDCFGGILGTPCVNQVFGITAMR